MSQISPQILLRYGRQNQPVRVPISDLLVDPPASTYLSGNSLAGDTNLSVQNTTNFAINQILLIGDPGNGNSEIVRTSSVTPPTSSAITLQSPTVFSHTSSTPVVVLYYDQVQIFNALTTSGAKTLLTTASLNANQDTTDYDDVAGSSGYYFARFRNSVGSTVSTYSAPSPVDAYGMFSARAIIDAALGMINKQTSDVFSDEYAFVQIDNCQMEVLREFKRWSWMQSFNTIIGTTQTGTWKIAVPTDMDDQVTYKSIWNFRIGREYDMVWVDKAEFDALIQGTAYSTVDALTLTGATSLVLDSTKDFNATSGAIQVGPNVYTYSANNTLTNTLTLASPLVADVPADQDVFQFASLGYPVYWTIWDGFIYHWPIVGPSYTGRNYWLDYYKKLTQTTTDDQNIVIPDPTVVQYYLAWKFLLRMNNGEETPASQGFYNNYVLRRDKMKQKESVNRNFIFNADLDGGNYY
jgi:hypothetical protein